MKIKKENYQIFIEIIKNNSSYNKYFFSNGNKLVILTLNNNSQSSLFVYITPM